MPFWESVQTWRVSPSVPWVDESEYFSPPTCHGRWSTEHENNFLSPQQRVRGMLGVHSRSPKNYSCIFRASSLFRHHLAVMLVYCIVIELPNRTLLILTSGSQGMKSDLLCDHPNLPWIRAISEQRQRRLQIVAILHPHPLLIWHQFNWPELP